MSGIAQNTYPTAVTAISADPSADSLANPSHLSIAGSLELTALETFLREEIAPLAQAIDQDPRALATALQRLGDRQLLALRVPSEWGGAGASGLDYWQFQGAIARVSGTLAFLQTQHQSAANFINNGQNETLKQQLPAMAQGKTRVGVGFSHLRRRGKPCLRAIPGSEGEYHLTGTIPWATGWQLFDELVVGASLPDGRSLLALIPFRSSTDSSDNGSDTDGSDIDSSEINGTLRCGEPMALAAMQVTQTVAIELNNFRVRPEQVIEIKPVGWLMEGDRRNVLASTSLVLGCAQAGLDVMAEAVRRRSVLLSEPDSAPDSIPDPNQDSAQDGLSQYEFEQDCLAQEQAAQERLAALVEGCRREIVTELQQPRLGFEQRVALRARAIDLCGRCGQGAIASSSGAANALTHPAQRIYRESLVFTVTGQTPAVRAATLAALSQEI